jgi:chemotaxis family two-component system sensor kinase Cph1
MAVEFNIEGHTTPAALAADVAVSASDLDACAREPIRIPGGIQPHGVLLILDNAGERIIQTSANTAELLGLSPVALLNQPFSVLCAASLERELRKWLAYTDSPGSNTNFLRTAQIGERLLQVLAHRTAQGVIIEFEQPPSSEDETLEALYPRIGRFMEGAQSFATLDELSRAAAIEFRRVSGFNRVLIYRFDHQWHGEVIAEDGDGELPSYLGLRFPASDIPAQARELYRLNRLRLIPDAAYVPSALQPTLSPIDGAPLDLSYASLRSVSPVHLEYMRNMGTLASMSVSILVEGRLWGLVSCHNRLPKQLNAQARTACDLLGMVLSQQIASREQGAYAARRIALKQIEGQLLSHLAMAPTFQEGLAASAPWWLKIADAHGAVVLHDDGLFTAGITPPESRIRALAERLREDGYLDTFATDSLALTYPEFADIADVASGVLAISISQLHPAYIIWLRPELIRTIRWSGDPTKSVESGTQRLHPRTSFASWKEQVLLHSASWSRAEIDSVSDFRAAIINLVLRRAEERAQLTGELQRSNRELESFSYSVSHDLRAPFRHIVGYTQLLRDREKGLSEKSQHYLDSINEAATTAGRLVDDLLSFSHLGRTSVAKSSVDMQKLVREVQRSLEPDTQNRNIQWCIGPLPSAWADPNLLRQAMLNLLGNAVKYTRGRDPAVVTLTGELQGNLCVYSVGDNGAGFDMAYVHKLFGVFQRLHRMEDFEGTGIGLALTKRIVERHDGWIKAHGNPDQGATFTFAIPLPTGDESNG